MAGLVPRSWVIATVTVFVAGAVLLAISGADGTVGIIGFALFGLGAVVATALAFYAVGRSEDIDRESRPNG
jgi:hypothetical protein